MAQDVAKVLKHYAKLYSRNHQKYEDIYRIFCGKEFIYASFRTKIVEILH
jgi:hypothetical protein